MSFPDTITLTIASVAKVLNRINQDKYGSEYQLNGALESVNLKVRHTVDLLDKSTGLVMKRHNLFIEHIVYPTPTTFQTANTYTLTMRHGIQSDPTPSVDLAKAANVWVGTSTNLAQLGVGIN